MSLSSHLDAQSSNGFVMKINPVDFIYSWNITDFEVSYFNEMGWISRKYPINSSLIIYPSLGLGWGWNNRRYFSDITIGFGFVRGGIDIDLAYGGGAVLKGPIFSSDLAFRYRFSNVFSLGINLSPLIGNINMDTEDQYYSTRTGVFAGFYVGPTITLGNKASFYFSLNYLFGHLNIKEITASSEWDEVIDYPQYLDISGIYFKIGLLIRTKHPHLN